MVRHGLWAQDEVLALSWPMPVKRINEAAQPTINPPICPLRGELGGQTTPR